MIRSLLVPKIEYDKREQIEMWMDVVREIGIEGEDCEVYAMYAVETVRTFEDDLVDTEYIYDYKFAEPLSREEVENEADYKMIVMFHKRDLATLEGVKCERMTLGKLKEQLLNQKAVFEKYEF